MQNPIGRNLMVAILTLGFGAASVVWAASEKESEARKEPAAQRVTLADLPAAVHTTIDREMPGAEIKLIEKEEEHGNVVYDVEAKFKGKDVEMDIASDGKVLTREESVPFASLPAAVRVAAEKDFGGTKDLDASKEGENGRTFYEVEGKKAGQKAALKFTEDGRQAEKD